MGYGEAGVALLLPILSRRQDVEVASVDPTDRLAPAGQLGEGSPARSPGDWAGVYSVQEGGLSQPRLVGARES